MGKLLSLICLGMVFCGQDTQAHEQRGAHFLLVANAPGYDYEEYLPYREGRIVIAVDGAADHLHKEGFHPHLILGDFDSIRDRGFWERLGIPLVLAEDQNFTDTEKAILFCDQRQAASITIVNATGGRMDHTLANLRFLRKYHSPERPLHIISGEHWLEFVREGGTTIEGEVGDPCAVMAFPEGKMTSQGLRYDVESYPLRFGESESVCNSLESPPAHVWIQGEALVMHPNRIFATPLPSSGGSP